MHWVHIESEQTVATLPFIKGRNQRSNEVHMAELTLARGNKIHPAGQILQHVLIHLQSEHIFYLFNFFLSVVDYCQSFRIGVFPHFLKKKNLIPTYWLLYLPSLKDEDPPTSEGDCKQHYLKTGPSMKTSQQSTGLQPELQNLSCSPALAPGSCEESARQGSGRRMLTSDRVSLCIHCHANFWRGNE